MLTHEKKFKLLAYFGWQTDNLRRIIANQNPGLANWGNIGILEVRRQGDPVFDAHAYSRSSRLGPPASQFFAPSVPAQLHGTVGVAGVQALANHTEPKLLIALRRFLAANPAATYDEIRMSTQLDACPTCVAETLDIVTAATALMQLSGATPIEFSVVELNAKRVRLAEDL